MRRFIPAGLCFVRCVCVCVCACHGILSLTHHLAGRRRCRPCAPLILCLASDSSITALPRWRWLFPQPNSLVSSSGKPHHASLPTNPSPTSFISQTGIKTGNRSAAVGHQVVTNATRPHNQIENCEMNLPNSFTFVLGDAVKEEEEEEEKRPECFNNDYDFVIAKK